MRAIHVQLDCVSQEIYHGSMFVSDSAHGTHSRRHLRLLCGVQDGPADMSGMLSPGDRLVAIDGVEIGSAAPGHSPQVKVGGMRVVGQRASAMGHRRKGRREPRFRAAMLDDVGVASHICRVPDLRELSLSAARASRSAGDIDVSPPGQW